MRSDAHSEVTDLVARGAYKVYVLVHTLGGREDGPVEVARLPIGGAK